MLSTELFMENHATTGSYGNIHFISFRKGTSGQ